MRKFLMGLMALAVIGVACGRTTTTRGSSGPTGATSPPSATASADPCAPENLNLLASGTLTVGTDNPAFQPWFAGTGTYGPWKAKPSSGTGNPASGEGFESAVAYAIADKLGLTQDQVTWVPVTFNESFKPGDKAFDFDINEISYSPDAGAGRGLQRELLRRLAGARRRQGHADRAGHDVRGPQGVQAGRPDRHDQLQLHRQQHPARSTAGRVRSFRRRDPRRSATGRSTATSPTRRRHT